MTELENVRKGPLFHSVSIYVASLVVQLAQTVSRLIIARAQSVVLDFLSLLHNEVDSIDWFLSPSGI